MDRVIAIGDIHGCADALRKVVELVDPAPTDYIITLGDYIDRGDNSRDVIDQLIQLSDRCRFVPLLGNHELMMLASRKNSQHLPFWRHCGGEQTLESYGGSLEDIPKAHWTSSRGAVLTSKPIRTSSFMRITHRIVP